MATVVNILVERFIRKPFNFLLVSHFPRPTAKDRPYILAVHGGVPSPKM